MISVIIPVYNVGKYLDKTIRSVLCQTYSDFELILVNDGSTDNSGQICDKYSALDRRVRVFHKENGGVSSARNVGLRNIKGDLLVFIDGDDYIEPNYFSYAVMLFDEHKDVDVLSFNWFIIEDKINQKTMHSSEFPVGMISAKEYLAFTLNPSNSLGGGFPWNKFWKINSTDILPYYDESLWTYEDKLWNIQMLCHKSIVWIDNKAFYNYVVRNASLSHGKVFSAEKVVNCLNAYKQIADIDYHDQELSKLAYSEYCKLLAYRFFYSMVNRNKQAMLDIYQIHKMNWTKMLFEAIHTYRLKSVAKGLLSFFVGHTYCGIKRHYLVKQSDSSE